jgi:hypothetical protein
LESEQAQSTLGTHVSKKTASHSDWCPAKLGVEKVLMFVIDPKMVRGQPEGVREGFPGPWPVYIVPGLKPRTWVAELRLPDAVGDGPSVAV